MNENKQGLKYCSIVALLSLLLLLLGAIFYYKERPLFSDAVFRDNIYLRNKKISFPRQLIVFIPLASIMIFTHFAAADFSVDPTRPYKIMRTEELFK